MAHPVCSICSSIRRAEIDADLVQSMTAAAVAAKYGLQQNTVARHKRRHLKPHLQAIAQIAAPMLVPMSPPAIASTILTVGAMLADLGETVQRLKKLADDAEADGGLGIRAISLRELRSGLADAAKLVSVLAPPPAPPAEQVDREALADLFAAADLDSRAAILDRLVP